MTFDPIPYCAGGKVGAGSGEESARGSARLWGGEPDHRGGGGVWDGGDDLRVPDDVPDVGKHAAVAAHGFCDGAGRLRIGGDALHLGGCGFDPLRRWVRPVVIWWDGSRWRGWGLGWRSWGDGEGSEGLAADVAANRWQRSEATSVISTGFDEPSRTTARRATGTTVTATAFTVTTYPAGEIEASRYA